jgi:hypothetical protein
MIHFLNTKNNSDRGFAAHGMKQWDGIAFSEDLQPGSGSAPVMQKQ